jgi:hypothetical protein
MPRNAPALLTIPQRATEALSPAQRKFNQLQKQLAAAREELLAWDAAQPPFAEAFEQQVRPLQRDVEELERLIAHRLDAWLQESKGWTAGERGLMRDWAAEVALSILNEHLGLSDAERAHWRALHDRHAAHTLAAQDRAQQAALRREAEAMAGIDLGDAPFDSAEALLEHLQRRLAEEREAREAQQGEAAPGPRRPTKAQARRAAAQAEAAAQAKQGLREVFRRLASHLHPDRAPDAAEAARRTALMQRANAAYAKEDLLGLLMLQLELEQIDTDHLKQASQAQLQHFNEVLAQQLDELRHELLARAEHFCAQFNINPRSPPKPAKLGAVLAEARQAWNAVAFEAQRDADQLATREGTKRWVKRLKLRLREAY